MSLEATASKVDAGPAVRLTGVRKRFGYRDVLRGVDLEIPRGSCFVVFGPNGAGKSTLLRIVATQWTFTSGHVEVLGKDIRKEPTVVRGLIGLVLHDSFLRWELTLEENLRFACDLHGIRAAEGARRTESLLERFGLAHRRHDVTGTFSRGMLQRAGLVRSLLAEPKLWILDEPFSGLDPAGQELLEQAIREFYGAGGTVLLVTHQLNMGSRLATASAYIEDGAILRQGAGAAAVGDS
jgi:ABC-type multidrug transport system ATPase subunit